MASQPLECVLFTLAMMLPLQAMAGEEELPDAEFLEYLGLWDTSDEEWLLLEDDAVVASEERSEPVPQGEASTETEDES